MVKEGPAAQAGIKQGDVVITYRDKEIANASALRNAVAGTPVGQEVLLTMVRRGEKQQVTATVRNLSEATRALLSAVKERLGVDIRPVTAEETEQYGLQSQQGVMITQVEPNGAMAGTGLEAHDIILALAGQPIAGIESLTEVVSALPSHQRVALFALDHRSGSTGYVQVVIR